MENRDSGLIRSLRSLPRDFWLLCITQMAERLAFWCILIQLPVYIAQKDVPGGLAWEQTVKGVIFFWWAIVQNITPIFSGGFADKYGSKRIIWLSSILIVAGYAAMALNRNFEGFLAGAIILGFGSGNFKPALYGLTARTLDKANTSVGWGVYAMAVNSAVFLGPPLAIFMKEISWQTVFFGSAAVFASGLAALPFVKTDVSEIKQIYSPLSVLKITVKELFKPNVFVFLLLMTGFTIVYMQFYETLPNFLIDWTDSSALAAYLPDFMTTALSGGKQIAYEWYYNLNAGMIVAGVVLVSWYFSRFNILIALSTGIIVSSAGLLLCGASREAGLTIAGFLVYTFGEMITNPKFNDYMSRTAGNSKKSMYMGILNLSWAIGLASGALAGGYLYKHIAEKSQLSLLYLAEKFKITGINPSEAFAKLTSETGLNTAQATHLLWNEYSPWMVWLPFAALGAVSSAGMFIFYWFQKRKNYEKHRI